MLPTEQCNLLLSKLRDQQISRLFWPSLLVLKLINWFSPSGLGHQRIMTLVPGVQSTG